MVSRRFMAVLTVSLRFRSVIMVRLRFRLVLEVASLRFRVVPAVRLWFEVVFCHWARSGSPVLINMQQLPMQFRRGLLYAGTYIAAI